MREQNQTKRCKWQPRQEEYFITCSLPQTSTPSPFGSHPIPLSPRRARLIPCPEFVVSIYVREPQVRAANNIVNPIPNSEDAKMFCFNCPHQPSRGGKLEARLETFPMSRNESEGRGAARTRKGGLGSPSWSSKHGPGARRLSHACLLSTMYALRMHSNAVQQTQGNTVGRMRISAQIDTRKKR